MSEKNYVSKYGNQVMAEGLVRSIVKNHFHNPNSEMYVGDPDVKPDVEDQLFDEETYGDVTDYQREGVRYATACIVTPEWCRTQTWYKRLWAEKTGYEYEDEDDLEEMDIPESDWNLVPTPRIIVRCAEYSNSGYDMLLNVVGEDFEVYNPGEQIEYGASGPAYNGCYCEEDTKEITEWCDKLLEDLDDGSIWL